MATKYLQFPMHYIYTISCLYFSQPESKLGQIALDCMCKMLVSHPYFNLATNIVNFVVPFLNFWDPAVRAIVFDAIKGVFRIDKRGEISYEVSQRGS